MNPFMQRPSIYRPAGRPIAGVRQRGLMLIEALMGILLFSIGVLGLIAMHGASVAEVTAARERAQASYFANQLIGQMWSDDRTNLAQYAHFGTGAGCNFTGAATGYQNAINWLNALRATGSGLPGGTALSNRTQVSVTANTPVAGSTLVSVTICWKRQLDANWHSYTTVANISSS